MDSPKEEMENSELAELIDTAMQILYSEGDHILSHQANQELLTDLKVSNIWLANTSIDERLNENLQTLAHLSNDSMKAIYEIALAKFNEKHYHDSLSLFSLLSLLNSGEPEIWFRLGIAAQKCDKIELALRAYGAALEIDPYHVGARLFAAECFMKRNLFGEAKKEIAVVKKIIKNQKVDPVWLDLLSALENSVR